MQHPENLETPWSKYFPSEVKFAPGLGIIEALRRPFGTPVDFIVIRQYYDYISVLYPIIIFDENFFRCFSRL